MSYMYKLLLFFLITLFLFSCSKSKINKRNLKGCWKHYYEESDNTYRSCDYEDFEPSWYRFKMELMNNGNCKWLVLAANDNHYMVSGTWEFIKEENQLLLKGESGSVSHTFQVLSKENDKLMMEKQ